MADSTSIRISLIDPPSYANDSALEKSLSRLENLVRAFGFCQYSFLSTALSWLAFLIIAVALPIFAIDYSCRANCERYEIKVFEFEILVSRTVAAAISLLCISHNLRKYGIRKLLFVDWNPGYMAQYQQQYIQRIQVFYWFLVKWVIICFLLKAAHDITRVGYLQDVHWQQGVVILVISLVSWTYSTMLFLLGSALFSLVGSLQVIQFENYGKLLERDLDISVYIVEHGRLIYSLSKISHRFRIFLLLEFLAVTASQLMALFQTTGNMGIINFINAGDFAVLSIVLLVGIVLCFNAASKMSHRAQSLGAAASRWHALVTCNSNDPSFPDISSGANLEAPNLLGSLQVNYSESDLESSDYVPLLANLQLSSQMSSYQKRQAFVTYVQSNTCGFTIFGWVVDRLLVNTLVFMILSLISFVLGKTVAIHTR